MDLLLKIDQVVWRIYEFLYGKVFSWTVLSDENFFVIYVDKKTGISITSDIIQSNIEILSYLEDKFKELDILNLYLSPSLPPCIKQIFF